MQSLAKSVVTAEVESAVPGMGHPLPIRLSRIKRFEGQPRKNFDPKSIEELADSIQMQGQQTPVRVCTDPSEKGTFVLIGGERRLRAFQLIKERTGKEPTVNAFIEVIDPKQHFRKAVLDNLLREDLLPLEMAESLHKMHTEDGDTIFSLAKLIGKSTSYVENYIKLHGLPSEVKRLMDPTRGADELLSVTSAIDIARSTPDQKLRFSIAKETVERRLGVNDARTLIAMRTGDDGWRVGGFQRKSADEYKAYMSFLGRTRQDAERFLKLEFEGMYHDRDDEFGDREEDASKIESIIGAFKRILEKVKEDKPLR